MKKIFRNNGLSIFMAIIFMLAFTAQYITGWKEYNSEREEEGLPETGLLHYASSGHFMEATFENWESEFLQMGMLVVLAASLYQKGSSESNDPDRQESDYASEGAIVPWPYRKGKLMRFLYDYSLSIAFFILFIVSFLLHWYGSLRDYNEAQLAKGEPLSGKLEYFTNNRLWFESFQNWQSEFLSVFCVIIFSIFLRHKGSSQSKKIGDPDSKTGD